MKANFSPRLLLSALALSVGVAGGAYAYGPGPGGAHCGPQGGGRMGMGMEQGQGFGMRGMERLHADLKLDAKQEALWQEAAKSQRNDPERDALRERMRKQHADLRAALDQPGADLRALTKQMDAQRDEMHETMRKQHEARRERWLAVYDSLGDGQKEKVRLFFKSKFERMDGKMRGPRAGGPGRPAAPAPAPQN